MSGASVNRVVIVGRDIALWLSAATLSRALAPSGVSVVAVELPTRLTPAHVSAALPPLEALHAKLKIDEGALIRATGGSFSFGQNFVDTAQRAPSFFHAWGSCGASIDGEQFLPCWLRAKRQGLTLPLESFSPTAVAAKNGRMLLPDDQTVAFGRTDYGYHLPSLAYAGYLKALTASLSVAMHETRNVDVERVGGNASAIVLDDGKRIEGDLFLDASGEDALLIGGALGVAWESWRAHFGVDRVLTARAPTFTSVPPFAEIRADAQGWTALHPSLAVTGIVRAFMSASGDDESATQAASRAAGAPLVDIAIRSVDPGLRSSAWQGNCVAIGAAACALDPIHDADLQVLQLGLVHLLSLFPVSVRCDAERAEYNRLMRSHCARIRDFQAAFYVLARFEGAFWSDARARALPAELAHKVDTFRARALIAPMEDETFSPDSWRQLFVGLGMAPDSWGPTIDGIAPQRLQAQIRSILDFITTKVREQPTHQAYLDDLRGAGA
ncbi:MAG: tryptophan 7-halogenase [Pseudomonadota bacterium]